MNLGNIERVLASVAGLALYALNDARMFQTLPRSVSHGDGRTHAVLLQFNGDAATVFASAVDLALRWGLAGLTVAACVWAIAETLKPQPAAETGK